MTYSIVAHDPDEQAWGVAVASKFLAVGALVSWAKAGAGAVATQAHAKIGFGPHGLALLAAGNSATQTLQQLLKADDHTAQRQVGIVDAKGGAANGVWDESSQRAFWKLVGRENLEERWNLENQPDKIDRITLDYLRGRFR